MQKKVKRMLKNEQTFFSHLVELKKRVTISLLFYIVAVIVCYQFAADIYQFLLNPLSDLLSQNQDRKIIFTGLAEAFFSYLKLEFFSAFVISLHIFILQIYLFFVPALYENEKRIFTVLLILSPLLFILGSICVYYFVFPVAWKFFMSFESSGLNGSIPIVLESKVSEYLSLVINMIIAFGLAFQIPVILIILSILNIIDVKWLKKNRKISIVIIFIIAAVLTPPDVISQIILAFPMMALYEMSICFCKYIEYQRNNNNA